MGRIQTLISLLKYSRYGIIISLYDHFVKTGITNIIPDELFLRISYRVKVRKKLDLYDPQTFSEKLQWLKLHDRKSIYTKMVDKYAAKEYVANVIGEQYIIPTLGIWNQFDEIDFNKLPDQFVLKCTHDSAGLVICRDKATLDIKQARRKISKCLKRKFYYWGREWPYKDVKPRIIAEKYMEDVTSRDLIDYKFFCFGGVPRFCQVISNRSTFETIDFFDMEWHHQDFKGLAEPYKPFANIQLKAPKHFEKMKELAAALSRNFPFLRVDFYEVEGNVYFGELTFYPAAGFGKFTPDKWNKKLGDMIVLPEMEGE